MNWGYKILFVYVAFIAGTLFLVFRASGEKDDLVTEDYYSQELKYQQKIDQMSRTGALSAPVKYELNAGQLLVSFPNDFSGKKIAGNILLYCPSDEGKDIKQDFNIQDAVLKIRIPPAHNGAYELHINWQADGLDYYFEKKIFIEK